MVIPAIVIVPASGRAIWPWRSIVRFKSLRGAAPNIEHQSVARPEHIIRADRQVHRQFIRHCLCPSGRYRCRSASAFP